MLCIDRRAAKGAGFAATIALIASLLLLRSASGQTQEEFNRALGITTIPVTNPPVFNIKSWAYDVALDNCLEFGVANEFRLEWQLRTGAQNILEIRFTADSSRGFTGLGFAKSGRFQIISGNPVEQTPCARSLYDSFSAYDLDGSIYPNYPELPANLVNVNASHATHYAIRNISTTAARMLTQGGTMRTNVTLLWAYMQSSLFKGTCYQGDVDSVTESATFQLVLGDATYSAAGGVCTTYTGPLERHLGKVPLDTSRELLEGERHQSTRVATLLFGGDLLVRSGKDVPNFNTETGSIRGGENAQGVCQASLSTLKVQWSGFSDRIGGIVEYLVSAGTIARPSTYFYRESAATNEAYTKEGLTLTKNTTMIVTVEAYNFAEVFRAVTSKPIYVLNGNLPVFGTMKNGLYGNIIHQEYSRDTSRLSAYWQNWIPEDYSSKNFITGAHTDNGYDYAVGETDGTIDSVVGWTHVANFETQRTVDGLTLSHGTKYSLSVRTTNCAGGTTTQSAPGVMIDTRPPVPGRVYVGNSTLAQHRSVIFFAEHLQASWQGFVDTTSGMHSYEWAMSKNPTPVNIVGNEGMVMGWHAVGLLQFARNGTIASFNRATTPLAIGDTIYVHVKGIDNAANYVISNSNGTKIVG